MSRESAHLSVAGLVVRYGAISAVRDVDLDVPENEIVAIVGPNGAGKSSLLAAIAGIVTPARGEIAFAGKSLTLLSLEDIVRQGVALVPEGRHIFASLTVHENLLLGATIRSDAAAVRFDIAGLFDRFPILGQRRNQPAGQLSGGEQQQLAIARALLSRPRLLMLDEPSLGLCAGDRRSGLRTSAFNTSRRRNDPAGRTECRARFRSRRPRPRHERRRFRAQRNAK